MNEEDSTLSVLHYKLNNKYRTDGDEIEVPPPGVAEESVVDSRNVGGSH
jgi:hypothetical protein